MLLLPSALLDARRAAANGPLTPLADSLAADLEPVLARDLYTPAEKALLSRAGGRCADDGTQLEFDPFSPRRHRCPVCGRQYEGEFHDRAWVYPYQLWLAERAVHGALLYALRGDERHRKLAADILARYADAYLQYPNRDNVLGPTRLFFSTYLESIWLLQICIATDFLEAGSSHNDTRLVRERIVEPSAALIAQYDEGGSNRQVWNNAALMAAALLLGDKARAERVAFAGSGLSAHLANGLLPDGTWYEGENYHLFAHRGLWYGVVLAETAGLALESSLVRRFAEGFATPFSTALPDFTYPSRKDSQYAVSLRQWRYAELCELGLARGDDRRLLGALAQLYAPDVPSGDTGRARSAADVERNVPAARLTRADLGWRSLLHARATLPDLVAAPTASTHQEHQGFTVFRRETGRVYVALDWGQSGGGHGHPDRLNVLFADGDVRWLDDLGAGSYVDPSLHWYRSTLAHNAPLVDGRSQRRINGRVVAHEERGGVGWILAEADGIAPGVRVRRAIVVTPDYFVDELRWTADRDVRFELPLHTDATAEGLLFEVAELDGGAAADDGFTFVGASACAKTAANCTVALSQERMGKRLRAWVTADTPADWYRATGPGQPSMSERAFHVVRSRGSHGAIRSVWAWSPRVDAVTVDGDRIEVSLGEERHVHRQTPDYWQMELFTAHAKSGIELFGWIPPDHPIDSDPAGIRSAYTPPALVLRRGGAPIEMRLGAIHYRRSEDTWVEAGCPVAQVSFAATGSELRVTVVATASPFKYGQPAEMNPYDNENADINFPGVQCYVLAGENGGAWLVRPDIVGRTPTMRALGGWGSLPLRTAHCDTDGFHYRLQLNIGLPPEAAHGDFEIAIDVLINDAPPHRERRRGQLVLSGAGGEFVYLRGDRHDPARLVRMLITDRELRHSTPTTGYRAQT